MPVSLKRLNEIKSLTLAILVTRLVHRFLMLELPASSFELRPAAPGACAASTSFTTVKHISKKVTFNGKGKDAGLVERLGWLA